jgi:hypothetical protein
MAQRRRRAGVLLAVLVLVGLDQLLTRTVLADGLFLGVPVAPFDPPLFSPSQFQAFERIRTQLAGREPISGKYDPELGWCNRPESGFGEFRYDWAGARIGTEPLAREKAAGVRRVVAVGCSMTHGEEVGASESWCAQLDAGLPEVDVANLGVAAYGIDQALLRLRRDGFALAPDEVWLGVLPQAALRVTTFFRPILDHWSLDVAFKPRFLSDAAGKLELAPNPAQRYEDIETLLTDQRALLAALGGQDPWVAAAPAAYAPRGSDWRHHSFAGRLWLTLDEKRGREIANAFDTDHAFGQLFTAIVAAMQRDCVERRIAFRVLILPGRDDLARRGATGRAYWDSWCESLRAQGVTVEDLSSALLAKGALDAHYAPHGHFSASGSRCLATALAERLRAP